MMLLRLSALVGRVLSTRTVTRAEVKVLPALSVVITCRSYWPSATAVVSQVTEYGLVVSATPMVVQVPAPVGDRWNSAEATPDAASAELEETATVVPRRLAAAAGAVIEPVGAVASTRMVAVTVAVLLTLSKPLSVYW